MTIPHSDAFVFFGATGDLAFKKIFPSLQAMAKRGHLNVPVVGVARSAPDLNALKARARESLEKHWWIDPTAFGRLNGLLRYVRGDNSDPATYQALRKELGEPSAPPITWRSHRPVWESSWSSSPNRAAPKGPGASSRNFLDPVLTT